MRYSYEFRIGMVVVAFLTVLLVTMGALGYWQWTRPRGIMVRVYFERTTSGVTTGTNVYLGGAPIGFVRENKFDPDKNRPYLTLEISRAVPVAKDSYFTIEQESFFGEPRVYITQGNTARGVLTSGGVADNLGTAKPTFTDLVADLDYQLRDVSISVQTTLASAQSLLMQTQRTLLAIEPEIRASIAEVPSLIEGVRTNLDDVTREVNKTLGVVQEAGYDTRQTIQDLRKQVNSVFDRVDQSLAQLQNSLNEITAMIASPENKKSLEETLANIREASDNIRKLSETLGSVEMRGTIKETIQDIREVSASAGRAARSLQGFQTDATARVYGLEKHPNRGRVELGEQVQVTVSQETRDWYFALGQERVGSKGNGIWYFGYKKGPAFRAGVGTRRGAPSAQLRVQAKSAFLEAGGWWKSENPRTRYQIIGGYRTGRLLFFGGMEREDTNDPLALFGLGFAF
ncbi:MAG: MlaD family protein [bacterium JZ-2024 1]